MEFFWYGRKKKRVPSIQRDVLSPDKVKKKPRVPSGRHRGEKEEKPLMTKTGGEGENLFSTFSMPQTGRKEPVSRRPDKKKSPPKPPPRRKKEFEERLLPFKKGGKNSFYLRGRGSKMLTHSSSLKKEERIVPISCLAGGGKKITGGREGGRGRKRNFYLLVFRRWSGKRGREGQLSNKRKVFGGDEPGGGGERRIVSSKISLKHRGKGTVVHLPLFREERGGFFFKIQGRTNISSPFQKTTLPIGKGRG